MCLSGDNMCQMLHWSPSMLKHLQKTLSNYSHTHSLRGYHRHVMKSLRTQTINDSSTLQSINHDMKSLMPFLPSFTPDCILYSGETWNWTTCCWWVMWQSLDRISLMGEISSYYSIWPSDIIRLQLLLY